MKVFLGGTCNGSSWREDLKPLLKIDFFDPVVPDWTEECYQEELKQREECDFCLYVITAQMSGVYSIAEVVDDSNKRPEKTIFCVLEFSSPSVGKAGAYAFHAPQLKSLHAVGKMVKANGGEYFTSLKEVAEYLNLETESQQVTFESHEERNAHYADRLAHYRVLQKEIQ